MKAGFVIKGGPGSGNFGHRGRPGLVGGSVVIGAPEIYASAALRLIDNDRTRAAVERFISDYAGTSYEHALLIDRSGLPGDVINGEREGVALPDDLESVVRYGDGVAIHNHPAILEDGTIAGWGFSPQDIVVTTYFNFDTMIAIGTNPEGRHVLYMLKRKPGATDWNDGRGPDYTGNVMFNFMMALRGPAQNIMALTGSQYEGNAFLASHLAQDYAQLFGHTYIEEVLD